MGFEDGTREVVAEVEMRDQIDRALDARPYPLPKAYMVDLALFRDKRIIAWVIARDRPRAVFGDPTKTATLPLSVQRFAAVRRLTTATGTPAIYAVRDSSEEIRAVDLATVRTLLPDAIRWGTPATVGREGIATEPVIHIPVEHFRPLKEIKCDLKQFATASSNSDEFRPAT